ncbi:MAG: RecX family transcriptional regulator [Bacteroidaceae bacterium]|nr:RecX family transcriptional regulator [Bacteroidaceae bacterium]
MQKKGLTYEEALNRCETLCSRCEHSTGEMERKLRQWGVSSADADRIICHLLDERYIDNHRFARAFALDKARYNSWGRIKIAQHLRVLGVEEADVQYGLSEIPDDEYLASLHTVLERKLRSLTDEDDFTRRGKLVRHALSHGFEMELVLKAVEE